MRRGGGAGKRENKQMEEKVKGGDLEEKQYLTDVFHLNIDCITFIDK